MNSDSEDFTSYSEQLFYSSEPFDDYPVKSNTPSPGFYSFVLIYSVLAFLSIVPLVSWSRNKEGKSVKTKEVEGKQVEIEQHNNSKSSSRKGEEANLNKNKKIEQEKYSGGELVQNSSNGHQGRDTKKESSTSSNVLRKFQLSERRSSSSVNSDGSDGLTKNSRHKTARTVMSSSRSRRGTSLKSAFLRELDQSYPDQDPDFQNRIALRFPVSATFERRNSAHGSNQPTETSSSVPSERRNSNDGHNQQTETSSSAPSAATTGRIYQNSRAIDNSSDKGFSKLVLDVGGRRWKNRRPIGRVDVIENVFASNIERQSPSIAGSKSKMGGSLAQIDPRKTAGVPSKTCNSRVGPSGIPQQANHQQRPSKGMSDIASSILSEQYHQLNHQPQIQIDISLMKKHQLEQLRLQQQYQVQHQLQFFAMQRQQQQQRRYSQQKRFSRFGSRSVSERSASVMSSIVDDIAPEDAADANDPGRGNIFVQPDEKYWAAETDFDQHDEGCCSTPIESLLLLAVPDIDKWNVLQASIPLTLGASSEALFKLITIAFISQCLGTRSMIAFLLVGLFVRLTSEELSSAIIDALSSFVEASMEKTSIDMMKSNYIAGQYIQLAVVLQVVLNIPLLVLWVILMDSFVMWLVKDATIAGFAYEYASIAVFAYMVQALSRTVTVVFHICGHEHFESIIDLVAALLQVIAIACVVTFVDGADLNMVAGIQVLINIASAIAKIAYPAARGWIRPFRKGLIQNVALLNYRVGLWHLFKTAGPLLLGTILEYGEWELLTLFIHPLGPAEVATWALLGSFWDFFEALTEGIGEAAANQVTYLLSMGQVESAKKLCYGTIYMAVFQAVLVTSALYISGQYLAVIFTTDPTIQHMMNNTIVLVGFANVIMAFSQITWSLIGAQGRFRLATFVIFFSRWMVTMPCALVCIYVFDFDLNAVSGSLVVGYATASCALTVIVLSSDWDRLARLMLAMNQQPLMNTNIKQLVDEKEGVGDDVNDDDRILGLVDVDNFDDSDDDSDGFGFGDYGDDDNDPSESLPRDKRPGVDEKRNTSQSRSSSRKSKS